ncbi:MAG: carbohydrate ABC transporter permease [Limnochordia bacterium]
MLNRWKSRVASGLNYSYLIVCSTIAIFPLLWIILSSVKQTGEMTSNPTAFWPQSFTLSNFRHVLDGLGFANNIVNSFVISFASTAIAIAVSALGAYGVARFFPKFGKLMTRSLVITYMFPPILLAIPYSIILGKLGLVNTRMGLVLVYLSFSIPYAMWLLVGFFETVSVSLEEAARLDGASNFQVFFRVSVPIILPGIVATAIYTFINTWNEFLYALVFINSSSKMPVSVALKSLEGVEILDWGAMMAASAVVVVPSIVFFIIIQGKIVAGLAEGSDK